MAHESLVRVTLPDLDGAPQDEVVLSFSFANSGGVGGSGSFALNDVIFFINSLATGQVHALSGYFRGRLSRGVNVATAEEYDISAHLDGSPAGSPIGIANFTLGNYDATNSTAPPQIALLLNTEAAYGSDVEIGPVAAIPTDDRAQDEGAPATHPGRTRPRARDRGRLFLPMTSGNVWIPETAGTTFQLAPAASADVIAAATHLAGVTSNWSVWSRRNGSLKRIITGHTDLYPKTIRKRGKRQSAVAGSF